VNAISETEILILVRLISIDTNRESTPGQFIVYCYKCPKLKNPMFSDASHKADFNDQGYNEFLVLT